MILVTFAVPFESAEFRAKVPETDNVECLHTGIGRASAHEALRTALSQRAYSRVIISGFAGGLSQSLRVGDLITTENEQTSNDPISMKSVKLRQSDSVLVDAPAKASYRTETRADAVDMETQTISEICRDAGVPFRVIRVISDDALGSLVVPSEILTDVTRRPIRGGFRLLAFLAIRPTAWGPFAEMVRNCRTAQRRLADALTVAVE